MCNEIKKLFSPHWTNILWIKLYCICVERKGLAFILNWIRNNALCLNFSSASVRTMRFLANDVCFWDKNCGEYKVNQASFITYVLSKSKICINPIELFNYKRFITNMKTYRNSKLQFAIKRCTKCAHMPQVFLMHFVVWKKSTTMSVITANEMYVETSLCVCVLVFLCVYVW